MTLTPFNTKPQRPARSGVFPLRRDGGGGGWRLSCIRPPRFILALFHQRPDNSDPYQYAFGDIAYLCPSLHASDTTHGASKCFAPKTKSCHDVPAK